MQRNRTKGVNSRKILRQNLLSLCDNFAEFTDQCTFLCDAFAAISTCDETINPATANGIGHAAPEAKGSGNQIRSEHTAPAGKVIIVGRRGEKMGSASDFQIIC